MGYMDISISGSDTAADCHSSAIGALLKVYKQRLKERNHDNGYNTLTSMNIAMSITTTTRDFWDYFSCFGDGETFFDDLATVLDEDMKEVRKWHKEDRSSNSRWHLDEYSKIHRRFKALHKFIKQNEF